MPESEREPQYAKGGTKSDLPWYCENIDKYLNPETQQFFESYSGIPQDQQSEHVHKIRDAAWAIRTYPCTGLGVWLIPYICQIPGYSRVLERLKSGGNFMDIGCFLGCDMRTLVNDGCPSSNMYGVDIVSHQDVGFDCYRDKDRFDAKFDRAKASDHAQRS